MNGDVDENGLGGLGSQMEAPAFDAGDLNDDTGDFSIDLPTDDEPPESPQPPSAHPAEAGRAETAGADTPRRRGPVMELPIDIVVSVGRARPTLTELVELTRDSVLKLESRIDDPVELLVGDKVIARGELQEIDAQTGRLGVRLTEVSDPRKGL